MTKLVKRESEVEERKEGKEAETASIGKRLERFCYKENSDKEQLLEGDLASIGRFLFCFKAGDITYLKLSGNNIVETIKQEINKIYKPLARLTIKKRERTQ